MTITCLTKYMLWTEKFCEKIEDNSALAVPRLAFILGLFERLNQPQAPRLPSGGTVLGIFVNIEFRNIAIEDPHGGLTFL